MEMADISSSTGHINKPRAPASSVPYERGYSFRASAASETACKMKMCQQAPPDRHLKFRLAISLPDSAPTESPEMLISDQNPQ